MAHNYDRRQPLIVGVLPPTAAITGSLLDKSAADNTLKRVLTEAFLALKPPYLETEYQDREEAARAFGETIAPDIERSLDRLLDQWGEAIQDFDTELFRGAKPVFASRGSEHVWDEYNDDDLHVYYECTFASPIVHTVKLKVLRYHVWKNMDWPRDFGDPLEYGELFAHPPVADAIVEVLKRVVKSAKFSDPRFGKLADLAIEHSYRNSETDFKANDDKDDDMYVNPIPAKIAITVDHATMTAETASRNEVLFTTTFQLKGEVLWPSNRKYREYM